MEVSLLRRGEADAAISLWSRVFGDRPQDVRCVFDAAGLAETTVAAREAGRLVSVMCAFNGIRRGALAISYVCALATEPDFRGRGAASAVLRAITQNCFASGADAVCLHPADTSLARWYAEAFGMTPLGSFDYAELPLDGGAADISELTGAQYAERTTAAVSAELACAAAVYGSRFFECKGGCFTVSPRGETALVCPLPPDCAPVAVSACRALGCRRAVVRRSAAFAEGKEVSVLAAASRVDIIEELKKLSFPVLLD
ncbi:MAG: GNAT family N-acetyltransferase [Oscillospiraceae bacterium]|nr:GNAT family N-acetyltransferase [Oscillospiraceae bacterium]